MMTEVEASKRWCPFSRVVAGQDNGRGGAAIPPHQSSFNRVEIGPAQTLRPDGSVCIGSGCMAWRWIDDPHWVGSPETRRGYCGIAGRPGQP